jgi:Ca2+-binding RTX toxin-like protein
MANIPGTPQNDTLTGSEFDDSISGNGGNDSIDAGAGNDVIYLLAGAHTIKAGAGNDIVIMTGPQGVSFSDFSGNWDGGSGYDSFLFSGLSSSALTLDFTNFWGGGTIALGSGTLTGFEEIGFAIEGSMFADSITLGAGSNRSLRIVGHGGNDTIVGANVGEDIDGGAGEDFIDGLAGDDTIFGAAGKDTLHGRDGSDAIFGGEDRDTIYGEAGDDVLGGGLGNDYVDGGDGNDEMLGDDGNDTLIGGAGDDRFIIWATGTGSIDGGSGTDTVLMDGQGYNTPVIADLTSFWTTGSLVVAGFSLTSIERLRLLLSSGDDHVTLGDNAPETQYLQGFVGNDYISGSRFADTFFGNEGDDTLLGRDGDDRLDAGEGVDSVDGGIGNDSLIGGYHDDMLIGGDGNDTLFGDATDWFTTSVRGHDTLLGGDGNDALYGGWGDDLLEGGAGDDSLNGGVGADILRGGDGDDVLVIFEIPVEIDGGAGIDTLFIGDQNIADGLKLNLSGLWSGGVGLIGPDDIQIKGIEAVGNVSGSFGADTITLGTGYAGPLLPYVALYDGDDYLSTGDVVATVYAGEGDDHVIGGVLDNALHGEFGNDTLDGGKGNDTIDGGVGADILIGGEGDDVYDVDDPGDIVTEAANEGMDLVRASASHTLAANIEKLSYIGTAAATLTGNVLDNSISGGIGNDVVNGGGGNDMLDGGVGGNDSVDGGDGNDTLYGGVGVDTLDGGDGNDYLFIDTQLDSVGETYDGGAGFDTLDLISGFNNLALHTIANIERLDAGFFHKVQLSSAQAGSVQELWGNFELTDSGSVSFAGKSLRHFQLTLSNAGNSVDLGNADVVPELPGGLAGLSILGGDSGDLVISGLSNDYLLGGGGADTLRGGAGADVLYGGEGRDMMEGGSDDDIFWITEPNELAAGEAYDGGSAFDTLQYSGLTLLDLTQVNLIGIERVDSVAFAPGSIRLTAAQIDQLTDLGSTLFIVADAGAISLSGARSSGPGPSYTPGNTKFQLSDFGNTLDLRGFQQNGASVAGGAHADKVWGTTWHDTITGGGGNDTIDAGLGTDRAIFTGNQADYRIVMEGQSYRVTDLRAGANDGSDLLTSVEVLVFADGEVVPLPPPGGDTDFRFVTMTGFTGGVGGYGTVFGTNGFQDITVFEGPTSIVFDGSFARGGDILRLPGNAADYSVTISGSNVLLLAEGFAITVPIGTAGLPIAFADGVRTLVYDGGLGSVRIGAQAFSETVQITAAPDGAVLPGGGDPAIAGRLVLFSDFNVPVSAAGKVNIFGTNLAEDITLDKGSFVLDGSFSRGWDTIHLSGPASGFKAYIAGSSVVLTSSDTTLNIPIGLNPTTLDFAGDGLGLRYDNVLRVVKIGDQWITATSLETANPLAASALALTAENYA